MMRNTVPEGAEWDGTLTPESDLANRTMTVCYATTSVVNAWVLPLFDKAFDKEPELRNRLLCLLVCGLIDSGREYLERINGLKREAQRLKSVSCPFYLDMFSRYIALAVDLLEVFSREDMILLNDLRNQWLHGHWTEVHKATRTVYYAKNGKIERERIPSAEHNKALSPIKGGVDAALTPLRKRFCEFPTFFWSVSAGLSSKRLQDLVLSDLMLHENFKGPKVIVKIPDPDFKPVGENIAYGSLLDIGPRCAEIDDRYSR